MASANGKKRPESVAFIVSSRGRPRELASCLASLVLQDDPKQIVVATTNENRKNIAAIRKVCRQFDVRLLDTRSKNLFYATASGVHVTKSEWLCFPNDDAYLVPFYSRIMIREANKNGWDMVYCDCIYDPRMDKNYYTVFEVEPVTSRIDKVCVMVRRKVFHGFPLIDHHQFWTMADGLFVRQLVKEGVSHGKCPGVMAAHN